MCWQRDKDNHAAEIETLEDRIRQLHTKLTEAEIEYQQHLEQLKQASQVLYCLILITVKS